MSLSNNPFTSDSIDENDIAKATPGFMLLVSGSEGEEELDLDELICYVQLFYFIFCYLFYEEKEKNQETDIVLTMKILNNRPWC